MTAHYHGTGIDPPAQFIATTVTACCQPGAP